MGYDERDDGATADLVDAGCKLTAQVIATDSRSTRSQMLHVLHREAVPTLLPPAAAMIGGGDLTITTLAAGAGLAWQVVHSLGQRSTRALLAAEEDYTRQATVSRPREREFHTFPDEVLGGLALSQTFDAYVDLRTHLSVVERRLPLDAPLERRAFISLLRGISCQEGGNALLDEGLRSCTLAADYATVGRRPVAAAMALLCRSALGRKSGDQRQALQDLADARRLLEGRHSYAARSLWVAESLKWAIAMGDRRDFLACVRDASSLRWGAGDNELRGLATSAFEAQVEEAQARAAWHFRIEDLPHLKYRLERVRALAGPYSVWRAIAELTEARAEVESDDWASRCAGVARLYKQVAYSARNGHIVHRDSGLDLMLALARQERLPRTLRQTGLCRCGADLDLAGFAIYLCSHCQESIDLLRPVIDAASTIS